MSDLVDELTRLLFESSFMTVATTDGDGLPWATPVEFVCDEDMRFYWISRVDARHSQNVRGNCHAALAIYDSRQKAGINAAVQGLYARGQVDEFRPCELSAVQPALQQWLEWRGERRAPPSVRPAATGSDADNSWRYYRLTPTELYALDPGGHPELPGVRVWRVRVDLSEDFARAYRERSGLR